jgi:pimeloyl-ACP methyl ester carboxylesterase
MHYLERAGTEPAVLCIHGYCQSSAYWAPTLGRLALADVRGLAPDLPGFGASASLPGPYTMEAYADGLAALLDARGIERVALVGGSMGGVVAFEMARRLAAAGEKVAFLGLFDSYAGDYPKRRASMPISNKPFKVQSFPSKLFRGIGAIVKDPNYLKGKLIEIDVALRFSLFARDYESRTSCLRRICKIARRRYRLRPFPGCIVLFRTDDLPSAELYEPDPLLGWNGMALEGIEIHELPGRHGDYMREPQVQALAEKLVSCLAHARAATEASADEAPRAKFVPI